MAGDAAAGTARDELVVRLQRGVEARDGAAVDEVLRPIAARAAAGRAESVELLLYLIDRCRLAHAAIWSVLSDPWLVEDAAQETIVAVARGVHTYRSEARFTTWLHQVARHSALATLKQRRQDEPAEMRNERAGITRSLSSIVTDRIALDEAIAALPPTFREALVLREIEQLEYEEISARLGLPLGTVRSRIARARARLAVTLRDTRALPA